jgi:DHA2 family multidrug resistance protein-like MFS transporter
VLGLVVGALWVARQRRLEDPMIDIGLFRDRVFDTALGINFLAVFVAVGYFLFVAQYLQLVAGLSPLQAGLWSLPSALAFVAGSQAGPRIAQRVRPSTIVGAGLAVAGVGLVMLAFVDGAGQLVLLVAASVVISLGLAPVFGLTTEMIVGSAPEEKAGAASGISETGAELGGALGIAILGSIGVVIYRSTLARELPAELPAEVVEAASDTLGAATTIAAEIPSDMGVTVLGIAQSAFVDGMQISAAIAAVVAFGLAFAATVLLRTAGGTHASPSPEVEPRERPAVELEPMAECG